LVSNGKKRVLPPVRVRFLNPKKVFLYGEREGRQQKKPLGKANLVGRKRRAGPLRRISDGGDDQPTAASKGVLIRVRSSLRVKTSPREGSTSHMEGTSKREDTPIPLGELHLSRNLGLRGRVVISISRKETNASHRGIRRRRKTF